LEKLEVEIKNRKNANRALHSKLEERQEMLSKKIGSLDLTKLHIAKIQAGIIEVQLLLSKQLEDVFALSNSNCSIKNIVLPNSVFDGRKSTDISTALGHVAHYVQLLATYLFLPLRYPFTIQSSNSFIHDNVAVIKKRYPLFSKDRLEFEYAVYLLNKNIEQILNFSEMPVKNLRNTISNLSAIRGALAVKFSRVYHFADFNDNLKWESFPAETAFTSTISTNDY
jgi:hypothetical protein